MNRRDSGRRAVSRVTRAQVAGSAVLVAVALTALLVAAQGLGVLLLALSRSGQPTEAAPGLPDELDVEGIEAQELLPIPQEMLMSADEAAQAEGARLLIGSIVARWPDDHRRAFLVAITPLALDAAIEHCVPPSVTVGQAVLESGWGRSGLAKHHNNLFGVKGSGVELETTEYIDGQAQLRRERFARFDGWEASVAHHGELLGDDPRYAQAREHWDDWPRFLATVAPTYASDPAYVRRVSSLVKRYRLDEWDGLVADAARKHGQCGAGAKPHVD